MNILITIIPLLLALGVWGMTRSFLKLRDSYYAQKKLIELLKKDPERRKKIRDAYEDAIKNNSYNKFVVIEQAIKEEVNRLNNQNEQERILDAMDNNTQEGKKRYITNIVAGTISLN